MPDNKTTELSKEELALLIRSMWESLLAPAWGRNDLIDLGKLIFAKVPLKDVDAQTFARLMPHLKTLAQKLAVLLATPLPAVAPSSQEAKKTDDVR
jgi:hypothetical protein